MSRNGAENLTVQRSLQGCLKLVNKALYIIQRYHKNQWYTKSFTNIAWKILLCFTVFEHYCTACVRGFDLNMLYCLQNTVGLPNEPVIFFGSISLASENSLLGKKSKNIWVKQSSLHFNRTFLSLSLCFFKFPFFGCIKNPYCLYSTNYY